MRMTGITTGVGLPHNIGHSNAWRNYSVTEVNEYKSRQYGSKGNKYRFTVTGGNQLMYVPDKGQSFPIAKIRCETYKDGVTHYYLEWFKTANQLTQQQRKNAERCIKPETVRKSGDTNTSSNLVSVRDNPMLYGVIQAEMRERTAYLEEIENSPYAAFNLIAPKVGDILTCKSARQFSKIRGQLKIDGFKYQVIDNRTIKIINHV